jgi:hypothetical protein
MGTHLYPGISYLGVYIMAFTKTGDPIGKKTHVNTIKCIGCFMKNANTSKTELVILQGKEKQTLSELPLPSSKLTLPLPYSGRSVPQVPQVPQVPGLQLSGPMGHQTTQPAAQALLNVRGKLRQS